MGILPGAGASSTNTRLRSPPDFPALLFLHVDSNQAKLLVPRPHKSLAYLSVSVLASLSNTASSPPHPLGQQLIIPKSHLWGHHH